MTIEEIKAKMAELRERVTELRNAANERQLTADEKGEADEKMAEFEQLRSQLTEMEEREQRFSAMQGIDLTVERSESGEDRSGRAFYTNVDSRIPNDIHDITEYEKRGKSPEDRADLLVDGAMKWVDRTAFTNPRHSREDLQANVERLLGSVVGDERMSGREAVARRILNTGSPEYKRAFGMLLARGDLGSLTNEERELLNRSITTTQSGYAVPADIDPTVLLISSGAFNPFRAMSRVVTTTAEQWKGITSAAITASYDAESAEVSDDTPTLAQAPSISVEKAQSLVTFSIEAAQDWSALQAEMATEFADAKDVLEESKFTTGAGHGSNEPKGIITGATVTTTLATSVSPVLADIFSTAGLLPARWDRDAAWLMHKNVIGKFQALAIAAGGTVGDWATLAGPNPSVLNGAPLYRGTTIDSAWQTAGKKIGVYGSFKRGFVIVDRVGMSVELVPLIFNTANNLPDGRRGLYAYWRNSSDVVTPNAFVVLKTS